MEAVIDDVEFRIKSKTSDSPSMWKLYLPIGLVLSSGATAFYALVASSPTIALVAIGLFFTGLGLGIYFISKIND